MIILLRMTFWLMLVCLLLPQSRDESRKLVSSAAKAVDDVRGFCGRNPDVCEDAKGGATAVLGKVKNGVDIVQSLLTATEAQSTQGGSDNPTPAVSLTPSATEPAPSPPSIAAVPRWDSSLKAQDRLSPWRGPPSKL